MMESIPLRRRFWRLAVPNILSNLMVPVAGLVDMAMLGHLGSIKHLAGVALGTVIFDYVYWSFGFLRMGTTGMTAQAVGRADTDGSVLVAARGLTLAVLLGCGILLLRAEIGELGFHLLSGTDEVESAGRVYFDARILGAPATLTNFVLIGWFLGLERSDYALILSFVGNGANVVLDYVFIYRLDLGSYGAGMATMASQYLMLAVALVLMLKMPQTARLAALGRRLWDGRAYAQMLVLNGDILVRTFALQTAFAVFLNLGAAFGTTVLAANALLLKVLSVASYFIDGFAFAAESLAGIFHGEGGGRRLREILGLTVRSSLLTGLVMSGMFVAFPGPLFGLLTDHADVLVEIDRYVWWLLPVVGIGSIAYALDGYFIGLTLGRVLSVSMVVSVLVGFCPLAYVAWRSGQNEWLWLAMVSFMVMRVLTLGSRVSRTLVVDSNLPAGEGA